MPEHAIECGVRWQQRVPDWCVCGLGAGPRGEVFTAEALAQLAASAPGKPVTVGLDHDQVVGHVAGARVERDGSVSIALVVDRMPRAMLGDTVGFSVGQDDGAPGA